MDNGSAMDTLKGILGDNAEEKIKAVMSGLSQNSGDGGSSSLPALASKGGDSDGLEYLMRIKGIIDELGASNTDSRSQLLMSLRPFMRTQRQSTIDSAVRLLNLTKLSVLFKGKF